MKQYMVILCCLAGLMNLAGCSARMAAQQNPAPLPTVLLGVQPRSAFLQPPFRTWWDSTYRAYVPNAAVVKELQLHWNGATADVFLGTWCGDSRREVPRLFSILDAAGIPAKDVRIVALKTGQPGHKTSPGGEERGRHIFRVPTIVMYRQGREIGRVVELPVATLEADLAAIAAGRPYAPNYPAGAFLRTWFGGDTAATGLMAPERLAAQLPRDTRNQAAVMSTGLMYYNAADYPQAITTFRLATLLFPQEPLAWRWLAESYRVIHNKPAAIAAYTQTLALQPGDAALRQTLDSLRTQ